MKELSAPAVQRRGRKSPGAIGSILSVNLFKMNHSESFSLNVRCRFLSEKRHEK